MRRRRALLGLVVAIAALSVPRVASAHPAPFSYLDLIIRDQVIEGMLVLHVLDVAHELGIDPPDLLLEPAVAARERDRVIALIGPRLTLRTDRALAVEWLAMEPAPDRHGVLLRFRIPVARPGRLSVLTRMFPYDPIHQTFVNVYEDGDLRQQMIFNADSREYVYYTGSTQGARAVMRTFIPPASTTSSSGPTTSCFSSGCC